MKLNRLNVEKNTINSSPNGISFLKKYSVCVLGLVSLFNGISTLFRLFNAKAILQEEQ